MRVLILSAFYYPNHFGGAEVSTQLIAEALAELGDYDVHVLCHSSYGHDVEEDLNGVHVIRHVFPGTCLYFSKGLPVSHQPLLTRALLKAHRVLPLRKTTEFYKTIFERYDVVLISGNALGMEHLAAWKAAEQLRVPLVHILRDPYLIYHGGQGPTSRLHDYLHRKLYARGINKLRAVVAPTQRILDVYIENGITLPKTKMVVPNFVDERICKPVSYDEKNNDAIYVGTIGRHKGIPTLLKAFEKAHLDNERLVLVGRSVDCEPEGDGVVYLGELNLNSVYEAMAHSKVLLLPSEWDEAFGRVLVESVFNGTVCIGSNAGGIPEVLGYNDKYIFEAGNIEELSEKITMVLKSNKEDYHAMLEEQHDIMKRFSRDSVISEWKKLISEMV